MTVRLGLRFRDVPDDDRLAPAKGFAQATHWVQVAGDAEPASVERLRGLVEIAYEQNG
ncbi:hypothetical protein [Acidipropionibacterium timonense]|uniref:hypothetical protein n=1 Tax=Acidipropionibacterium timonense TaxID=2161818 RepID=UPI001FDA4C4A|nr:hypothetical protein [Acidipropionibacterium timonense]